MAVDFAARAKALVESWEQATNGEQPLVLGGDMCDPDTDRMVADITKLLEDVAFEIGEGR